MVLRTHAFIVCTWVLAWNFLLTAPAQQVVTISPADGNNANEVSVAINPKNPDNIVAVSMMSGYQKRAGWSNYSYNSFDGGKTWSVSAMPNPRNRIQGDDAICFTADGVALRSCISFLGIFEPQPSKAETAISISRSTDGGATWLDPTLVIEHLNTATPMEDKPYLVADNGTTSGFRGNVYIAWTRFDRYESSNPEHHSQIYFSRSTDGGLSFVPPYQISDKGGDCLDSDGTVEGAVPAVGTGGEVYVVWAGPRGLELDVSRDGGKTFGEDRVIYDMPGGWDSPVPGINRHNGMPVTGVDHSNGKFRGTLYVNWIDDRNGDLDVFVGRSNDGGNTWSDPVRVNDDPLKNGKPQFFTWMAVDPVDGSINVVFYDRRDLPDDQARLMLARSVDGGMTFKNIPIEMQPFKVSANLFFGDYSGIDAYNGRVAAAFTYCTGDRRLTAMAATIFNFQPGTLNPIAAPRPIR